MSHGIPTSPARQDRRPGATLRVAVLGDSASTRLCTLIESASGFTAPVVVTRAVQLRGFRGDAVVVHTSVPHRRMSAILDCCPACPPVLVLSGEPDPALGVETLRRGATSYLVATECSREEFLFSLRGTAEGHSSASPSTTTALVEHLHRRGAYLAEDDPVDLTPRDRTVLRLVADGCSNTEIGVRLGLSEKTIRNTVSRLYGKIQVSSRAEAIVWWINRWAS